MTSSSSKGSPTGCASSSASPATSRSARSARWRWRGTAPSLCRFEYGRAKTGTAGTDLTRDVGRVGHRVQEALRPTDALELVRAEGAPDVVVLDVTMPVMNGMELLTALCQLTGRPELPAVFLSARVEPEDVAAGRAMGAVYLTKPPQVDQADLISDGVIGLMDAIDKFERQRGLQFQTYAVRRIRGAI
ncbi:MAG: response regulator, partial [Aeromicrobium sp.]